MSPIGFAWKSLVRDPARAGLGIAGVAIIGALLLDMLLLARGLVVSFGRLLAETGFEVRVTATDSLPGDGPPIAAAEQVRSRLLALPEVAEVIAVRFAPGARLDRPGRSSRRVSMIGTEGDAHGEWRLESGSAPRGPGDVVVNRELARLLSLGPGAALDLRPSSVLPAVRLRVSGVAEFPFDVPGQLTAAVTLAGFRAARLGEDRDDADLLLVAARPPHGAAAAAAAVRRAAPELHAFSTAEMLEALQRAEFSYFRQISLVLASLTTGFAFLLVATLLTVAVQQRLGEVAALRALGFSRRRVAFDLLAEAAWLVGCGGLMAIPIGLALARLLDRILRGMPGIPERLHFFVLEPRAVALHVTLLLACGLLASLYPVWIATRLPIAATLRREVM